MRQEAGDGERHTEDEIQEAGDGEQHTEEETHNTQEGAVTQTECNFCVHRCAEVNRPLEENRQLQRELDEYRMSDSSGTDNRKCVQNVIQAPNLVVPKGLLNKSA